MEIDSTRNLVKVNVTSLSAFVIGNKEGMNVDFSSDKETFSLNEIVKI